MKRIVPLWIAALGGFVLIIAYFIPATQGWGEVAAIWFDIMAAVAFVLGGGNLLKIHLKKVSDRRQGWAYSAITVISFLVMLFVGLVKWGAPPAPNGEYYGETWAKLPLASVPVTPSVAGTIPDHTERLHDSVKRQTQQDGDQIVFRGWMTGGQLVKLKTYDGTLAWQCNMDKLYEASQPTGVLAGHVAYHAAHESLGFLGKMTDEQKQALLALNGDAKWQAAVETLYDKSQRVSSVEVTDVPSWVDPDNLPDHVTLSGGKLEIEGPMSPGQRDALAAGAKIARPIKGAERDQLIADLESRGTLTDSHKKVLNNFLDGSWQPEQLVLAINGAGIPAKGRKSACELYEEQQAGVKNLDPVIPAQGDRTELNEEQVAVVEEFASNDDMTTGELIAGLQAAGTFTAAQAAAVRTFVGGLPTVGTRDKSLAYALMKEKDADGKPLNLSEEQRNLLLDNYRTEVKWRQEVGRLFVKAHNVKFAWSGEYRAQGGPFWWLYEYAFKPLQATIFAMLAFYVASAAFRAFRAKNVEAFLLLGTAFIILLGRTFAGVFLTGWMPPFLSGLRIENLTVTIMQVFNTAGNRAIMIGIALGIASTSLKVLLGVDRSYLGSAEE